VQFGIRQIGSEVDSQQHRVFSINGKQILIRGAAWTHEMMLRQPQREEYEVRYARDMHLNALRLEVRCSTITSMIWPIAMEC